MKAPYDEVALSDLCAEVVARRATAGRSRVVAIDGPAGSGKTTLAEQLRLRLLPGNCGRLVELVHMDELFEGWTGLDASAALEQRVLEQILQPLAEDRPGRWQRFDWASGRFAEWHDLPPADVVILEGCGAGARAYADYLTLLVWVEAPRDVRLARGVDRDGVEVLPRWLAWLDSEASHFAANSTRERADLLLRTD